MRRRWKSRPSKQKRRKTFFFVLVIFFLFSVQSFIFVEKNLRPPLMAVAKIRIKQIATQAINTAITERIAQGTNFEKLIDWRTDKDGKITGFMLNYVEHMKITAETIEIVQDVLNELKDMPERIPLGQALNSAIIASFGPRVPVKFVPAGAVKADLSTRQQNAGINMILVEVYIRIMAEVAIIIPFDSAPEVVETEIPISYVLVIGDVPTYFYDGKGNLMGGSSNPPPSIAVPGVKTTKPETTTKPPEAGPKAD